MLARFGLGSEGGLVERGQHVRNIQAILARHRSDVAIVAHRVKTELFKNRNGFGVTLLHVTDDHVAADQLIESEHRRASQLWGEAPRLPKQSHSFSRSYNPRCGLGG